MRFLIFVIASLSIFLESCHKAQVDRPNVIFIMMDDLGYGQCGLYNENLTVNEFDPLFMDSVNRSQGYDLQEALKFSKIAMPTLNTLAEEGMIFTKAYTSSSLCAPSRLGIATGRLQNRMGIYRNVDCESTGIEPNAHLAKYIKEQGYATAHIGKWHIGRRNDQMIIDALRAHGIQDTLGFGAVRNAYPDIYEELWDAGYYGSVIDEHNPLENGFDYYFGYNNWASQFYNSTLVWENYEHADKQKGYNTDVFTDTALSFIKKQVVKQKPFYVQLHYQAVHDSLEPKAPNVYFDQFNSESYDLNNFYAHVYAADYNIARIINYLKDSKIYDNTIIVFTSDNGAQAGGPSVLPGNAPFSGHKGTYYQGGIRVPYVFHWPLKIKDPGRYDQLVSTMDILPTILDAIGSDSPDNLDGKSLLNIITGKSTEPVHDHLVWAGLHSRSWGFLMDKSFEPRGIERNHAPPAWVVIKNDYLLRYTGSIEPNLYKEVPDGRAPQIQLFNIKDDPAERAEISAEFPSKIDELMEIYKSESADFKPPTAWKRSKWEELNTSLSKQ